MALFTSAFSERFRPVTTRCLGYARVLLKDTERSDLFKHASAMAYVTLFSLIPSLAATFSLISLFKPFLGQDSALLNKAKTYILSHLATGTGEQLVTQIDGFLTNLDMTKIGLTGFAGLLFTLVMLLRQIEFALNRIWLVTKPRNVVTRFVYFWTFLTLGTLVVGLSIGVVSGFSLQRLNPFGSVEFSFGQRFLSLVTPWLSTFFFFAFLYKIVPNTVVGTRYAIYGAAVAATCLHLATMGYSWFAPNFTNYRVVYGALAALPLFLMWLYILWLITLFGALLAWRLEQRFPEEESTTGGSVVVDDSDIHRNRILQSAMPLIVLSAIHHRFQSGEAKGIDQHTLTQSLNLNPLWIDDALTYLKSHNYIVETNEERRYFPASPSDQLVMRDLQLAFRKDALRWADEWQSKNSLDFRPLLNDWLTGTSHDPSTLQAKIATLKATAAE